MKGTRLAEGQGSGVRGQGRAAIAVALVVAAVVVLLLGATTQSASATQGTLRVDSKTAAVGESVSVGVSANVGAPGLGAWTVDVAYDNSVMSAIDCMGASAYSVCSTTFGPATVLVTGAHTPGLTGDISLATFTFRCDRAGTSQLSLSVRVFADATPDAPQDIDATVQNGTIACLSPSRGQGLLRIESASANVGAIVSVDLFAQVGPPGLGAWTVDPVWDPSVLAAISCQPYAGGVCSMNFASDEGRITGASMTGLDGETKLATLYFRCGDDPGISPLELSIEVFADATPGAPEDINETVQDGTITCAEPAAPTATPASATPGPNLPSAGGGTTADGSAWPAALLALTGAAFVSIAFGVRRRA